MPLVTAGSEEIIVLSQLVIKAQLNIYGLIDLSQRLRGGLGEEREKKIMDKGVLREF